MELYKRKRIHFDNIYYNKPRLYEHIALYQFGDISCNSGYMVHEHKQVCYEISYVMSGKGWFATNGQRFDVEAGDIYINVPGEIHQCMADDADPYRYFYLGFHFIQGQNQSGNEGLFNHIQNLFDGKAVPLAKDRLDIKAPFINALKEFRNANPFSQMMTQSYFDQIIVLMYRNYFSDWAGIYRINQDKADVKEIVYHAMSYMDHHILNLRDLSDVSRALGYSYSYLSHLFTEETGISIRSYYAQKRLQKAIAIRITHRWSSMQSVI